MLAISNHINKLIHRSGLAPITLPDKGLFTLNWPQFPYLLLMTTQKLLNTIGRTFMKLESQP